MLLNKEPLISMEPFEADIDGISELKSDFINEAEKYVYFRKGEFENIVETVILISTLITTGITIVNYLEAKKKGLIDNERVIRVLTCKTEENRKSLRKLKRKGADIRILPDNQKGKIRYILNEKRFCIFIRQDDNYFFGFIGDNKTIKKRLVRLFNSEWKKGKKIL